MRLVIEKSRRLDLPWLMLGVFALWVVVVAALNLVGRHFAELDGASLCMLRRSAGVPCPTCGGTRAGMALLHFDPLAAIAHNPLVTSMLVWLVLWLMMRVGFGRAVRLIEIGRRGRAWLWGVGVVVVLANWVWVMHRHGVL